jgi:pimeloyl-ACP methyl ester carboxylesterase
MRVPTGRPADLQTSPSKAWFPDPIAGRHALCTHYRLSRRFVRLTGSRTGRAVGGYDAPMSRAIDVRTSQDPILAGTLHLPDHRPVAALVMVPGSGPSDRDNDVYFPPIRRGLLARSIAVASFDKRGVGGSAGDWRDTAPAEQTADVAAQLATLRAVDHLAGVPIGIFGHSQGGWVVLEVAAADPAVPFVVTNSGPGVTPAEQGRYATRAQLEKEEASADEIERVLAIYDRVVELMRGGADLETVRAAASGLSLGGAEPTEPRELELARRWQDHDPRPALERIACPILAIFGGADMVTPVEASVPVFRAAGARPGRRVDIAVLPGASHRLLVGEPPALHPDYLETLAGWIRGVVGDPGAG